MTSMNPADPGLSAEPGRERRSLLLPLSAAATLLLAGALWWILAPHGPKPPSLVFQSLDLGCRFEYPSALTAGPNFVRSPAGSILTIERHSLYMAKKDWVAGLPEILFSQVLIQVQENYPDAKELSRSPVTVDGRTGIEVILKGRGTKRSYETIITVVIAANDEWVYVLRSYSPDHLDSEERLLFNRVRETWKFLAAAPPGPAS